MFRPRGRSAPTTLWVFGAAAVAAFALGGCAVGGGGGGTAEDGCPPADLAARYELVGSPRLCGGCDVDCHLTTDSPNGNDLGDVTGGADENGDGIPDGDGIVDPGASHDPRVWAESTAYIPAPIDGIKIVPPGVRVTSMYAWAANTSVSTVTKVHLQNFTPDGVFRTGLQSQGVTGNHPSRTTVDILGCAYVANRAFSGQGSVTKIAGEHEDCPDLNNNGVVDSSSGLDDIFDWPGTVGQDECVLWNVPVGPSGGTPRALAIDALGRIWVGNYSERKFYVLSSIDGELQATVDVAVSPYGAAITPDGLLWIGTLGARYTQSIQTLTAAPSNADVGPTTSSAPGSNYGIAVNQHGYVFFSNGSSGGFQRYRPWDDTWEIVTHPSGHTSATVVVDENGYAITGNTGNQTISVFRATVPAEEQTPVTPMVYIDDFNAHPMGGNYPKGVCPDFFGNYWAANSGVMPGNPNGYGSVTAIDIGDPMTPGDGSVLAVVPVQRPNYTYSDFTGYGLMTFAALVGYIYRDYESVDACGASRSIRERLYYTATFDDPGVINFHGRAADNSADLPTASEYWLGTADGSTAPGTVSGSVPIRGPMPDTVADRYYFRLRIELMRAGLSSPVMHEWTLEEYCL